MKKILVCLLVTIFIFSGCSNKKENTSEEENTRKDQEIINNEEDTSSSEIEITFFANETDLYDYLTKNAYQAVKAYEYDIGEYDFFKSEETELDIRDHPLNMMIINVENNLDENYNTIGKQVRLSYNSKIDENSELLWTVSYESGHDTFYFAVLDNANQGIIAYWNNLDWQEWLQSPQPTEAYDHVTDINLEEVHEMFDLLTEEISRLNLKQLTIAE